MLLCKPLEQQYFDVLLFSLLFSGAVAYTHTHAVALFLFFYSSFWVMEVTNNGACPE